MKQRVKNYIYLFIIGLLLLAYFVAITHCAKAQTIVLNDNFTNDSTLNSNLWVKNGPSGNAFFTKVNAAVTSSGGSNLNIVDPNPTFSPSQGMGINGVSQSYQWSSIESLNEFSAPLTVQASVMATQSGGAAFCLWLRNDQEAIIVGFDGDLNSAAPTYGIWNDFTPSFWVSSLTPSPSLNTIYQLTITVNSAGDASLSLSSNGQNLGSISGEHLGTSPLRILMGQYAIYSGDTGAGPNQAYWKSITVTSSSPVITPGPTTTPTSTPASSPNPSSNQTTTPTSSSPTSGPAPTSSSGPTPSTSPKPSPSSSSAPTASPKPSSNPVPASFVSISIAVAAATFAAPAAFVVAFLAFKAQKTKQLNEGAPRAALATAIFLSFLAPVLMLAYFSINLSSSMYTVNMLEIASTLHVSIGTASQIGAVARFVGIFVGLLMGFLSVRFNHKLLLFIGQLIFALGILGSYFAPDFASFLLFQTLMGIGGPIIGIMAFTFVGELLPLEKRGTVVGLVSSALFIGSLTGSFVIGQISSSFNWRLYLLWWMLPVSVASMILSFFVLPSKPNQSGRSARPEYLSAFKAVLLNKSAVACMLMVMCFYVLLQVPTYSVTFYRVHFAVSVKTASYLSMAGAAFATAGSILGGRLVNPRRRRPLIIVAGVISASLTMAFSFMPSLWSALTLRYASAVVGTLSSAAGTTLVLEQVPKFRGTMMSLNSAVGVGFGAVLGLAVGGWILNFSGNNYQMLFTILGCFGIASSAIVLLTKDPTLTPNPKPNPELGA